MMNHIRTCTGEKGGCEKKQKGPEPPRKRGSVNVGDWGQSSVVRDPTGWKEARKREAFARVLQRKKREKKSGKMVIRFSLDKRGDDD